MAGWYSTLAGFIVFSLNSAFLIVSLHMALAKCKAQDPTRGGPSGLTSGLFLLVFKASFVLGSVFFCSRCHWFQPHAFVQGALVGLAGIVILLVLDHKRRVKAL